MPVRSACFAFSIIAYASFFVYLLHKTHGFPCADPRILRAEICTKTAGRRRLCKKFQKIFGFPLTFPAPFPIE